MLVALRSVVESRRVTREAVDVKARADRITAGAIARGLCSH